MLQVPGSPSAGEGLFYRSGLERPGNAGLGDALWRLLAVLCFARHWRPSPTQRDALRPNVAPRRGRPRLGCHGTALKTAWPPGTREDGRSRPLASSPEAGRFPLEADSTGAERPWGQPALTGYATRASHSTVLSLSFLLCETGTTAAPTHGCLVLREVMS